MNVIGPDIGYVHPPASCFARLRNRLLNQDPLRLTKLYRFMFQPTLVICQPVLGWRYWRIAVAIVMPIYGTSVVAMQPSSISTKRNEITKRSMVLVEFSLHLGVRLRNSGTEPLAVASG